jgi:hypothetical protein
LGNAGAVVAGVAAFLLVKGLIKHLIRKGVLKESDRDALVDEAIVEIPGEDNPHYADTRALLNSAKD